MANKAATKTTLENSDNDFINNTPSIKLSDKKSSIAKIRAVSQEQ
jgi:hypothetical protein